MSVTVEPMRTSDLDAVLATERASFPNPWSAEQRVALAGGVLGEVLLELADERALVGRELRAVRGGEIERVLVRHVDPRDRDGAVLVHLLRELPRELDGLHVGAEGAAEQPFEEALDPALDCAKDAHSTGEPPSIECR